MWHFLQDVGNAPNPERPGHGSVSRSHQGWPHAVASAEGCLLDLFTVFPSSAQNGDFVLQPLPGIGF